jgi:hypothetical protein
MLFVELWNVAEGRGDYASQIGTVGDLTADLAVDGDTNTDLWGGSCAWTTVGGISGEDYAWWMVDLGSQYAVHSVIIYSERGSQSHCKWNSVT